MSAMGALESLPLPHTSGKEIFQDYSLLASPGDTPPSGDLWNRSSRPETDYQSVTHFSLTNRWNRRCNRLLIAPGRRATNRGYLPRCLLYSAHRFFCARLIRLRAAADSLRLTGLLVAVKSAPGAWPIFRRISAMAFSIS